jgi:hypothetical protein
MSALPVGRECPCPLPSPHTPHQTHTTCTPTTHTSSPTCAAHGRSGPTAGPASPAPGCGAERRGTAVEHEQSCVPPGYGVSDGGCRSLQRATCGVKAAKNRAATQSPPSPCESCRPRQERISECAAAAVPTCAGVRWRCRGRTPGTAPAPAAPRAWRPPPPAGWPARSAPPPPSGPAGPAGQTPARGRGRRRRRRGPAWVRDGGEGGRGGWRQRSAMGQFTGSQWCSGSVRTAGRGAGSPAGGCASSGVFPAKRRREPGRRCATAPPELQPLPSTPSPVHCDLCVMSATAEGHAGKACCH